MLRTAPFRRALFLWSGLLLLGQVATLAAQAPPAPLKVAVIDVRRILTDSTAGKEALARLKGLQDAKIAEAKTRQEEIKQLQARITEGRLSLAEDKLLELQKQAQEKTIAFTRFQEDADAELQSTRDKAFDEIERRVLPIINQVGTEMSYTMIFNKFESGLVFASETIDITPLIIERFNASAAKGK